MAAGCYSMQLTWQMDRGRQGPGQSAPPGGDEAAQKIKVTTSIMHIRLVSICFNGGLLWQVIASPSLRVLHSPPAAMACHQGKQHSVHRSSLRNHWYTGAATHKVNTPFSNHYPATSGVRGYQINPTACLRCSSSRKSSPKNWKQAWAGGRTSAMTSAQRGRAAAKAAAAERQMEAHSWGQETPMAQSANTW